MHKTHGLDSAYKAIFNRPSKQCNPPCIRVLLNYRCDPNGGIPHIVSTCVLEYAYVQRLRVLSISRVTT